MTVRPARLPGEPVLHHDPSHVIGLVLKATSEVAAATRGEGLTKLVLTVAGGEVWSGEWGVGTGEGQAALEVFTEVTISPHRQLEYGVADKTGLSLASSSIVS